MGQTAKERLEDILQSVRDEHAPDARVRVVENADGTVDGEILAPVSRGESPEDVIKEIENGIRGQNLGKSWVATGFRFEPRISDYDRKPIDSGEYNSRTGLSQIMSFYYRNPAQADAAAIEAIKETHRRKYRKPMQVLVRVHWNRYGLRPPRESKA